MTASKLWLGWDLVFNVMKFLLLVFIWIVPIFSQSDFIFDLSIQENRNIYAINDTDKNSYDHLDTHLGAPNVYGYWLGLSKSNVIFYTAAAKNGIKFENGDEELRFLPIVLGLRYADFQHKDLEELDYLRNRDSVSMAYYRLGLEYLYKNIFRQTGKNGVNLNFQAYYEKDFYSFVIDQLIPRQTRYEPEGYDIFLGFEYLPNRNLILGTRFGYGQIQGEYLEDTLYINDGFKWWLGFRYEFE